MILSRLEMKSLQELKKEAELIKIHLQLMLFWIVKIVL